MITKLVLFTRSAAGTNVTPETTIPKENIPTEEMGIAYAKDIIANYNATLKVGEVARVLVEVEMVFTDGCGLHEWEKSNLVTVSSPQFGMHDTYRCRNCKITGKRFGFNPSIFRDKKYKSVVYNLCNKVKE